MSLAMPLDERERCPVCEARLPQQAEWCGQCMTPIDHAERYAAPDAFLGPPKPTGYSRRAKTDVSYGLFGRIVATIALGLFPVWLLLELFFPFAAVWIVAVWPILLPAIWKKTPIRSSERNS